MFRYSGHKYFGKTIADDLFHYKHVKIPGERPESVHNFIAFYYNNINILFRHPISSGTGVAGSD